MSGQDAIIFHEVSASFNEEQWMRLDNHRKDIYRKAMKEIHGTLIAQGYTILNPNIVFSIKKQDESSVCIDSHSMEKKSAMVGDFPDILMKIKQEPFGETPINQEELCVDQPSTSSGLASSCNIKQEDRTYGPISSGAETKLSDSTSRTSNAALIKKEEEGFSIDDYNSAGGEGTAGSSEGVPGFIKKEPDGDEEETDHEDLENIIPVVVKQEEPDPARNDQAEKKLPAHHTANGSKHKTVKPEPLAIETKKRRTGPQVRGDILSLDEREARRLRVLQGNVNPYLEQASIPSDPIRSASDIKVESSGVPRIKRDIESTDWCKCGRCFQMSTVEECVCCNDISGMNYPLNDDCITLHRTFKELCLDQDHLDFLFRFLGRIKRRNDIPYNLHKLRCMSYRAFVVWAHGSLDKRDCKPVPACVVKVVQELLPYPKDLNIGYMEIYDYPAAIMALDHI